MSPDTIQGIVYLVLIVALGLGVWIFILYLILGRAQQNAAALVIENRRLKRALAKETAETETEEMTDEELLGDVADLLSGL